MTAIKRQPEELDQPQYERIREET